eukprot:13376.XXX_446359_449275_1 [CDS] Oithona nana genome sequencing.
MQATQSQQCHTLQPENRDTQDKLVLAPIVFQGRLISRSNVYNSLYFVSLRVQRVLKGSVPKRMHRHMRLLFHTDSPKHHTGTSSGNSVSPCRPVTFEVKTGQKYAIYVKKVEMGRYVAVATPDTYTRKVRKAARKLLCQNCREACGPYGHDIHLREICAAWKRPPITEMTREEYESWLRVEKEVN